MIPLPPFVFINLSAKLQLLSSAIGVAIIRAFSIPVFAEGNVIDLGLYRIQVAEACSGLRYLFPLMSFGFLMGYLYRGPFWQRALLFLSTIPIAILMNSLRIGAIGITVEHWGSEAAEGFLHLFEGWTVFILCLALLFGEAALLWRLSGFRGGFADMLQVDLPPRAAFGALLPRTVVAASARPMIFAALALACAAILGPVLGTQRETIPAHRSLTLFPATFGPWAGHTVPLEPSILKQLAADDYLHSDYVDETAQARVNLYVVYFASQKDGTGIHSPQNCLPAGGWEIESIRQQAVSGGAAGSVNRVLIRKGLSRMLVYYWFHQRGRDLTREIAVKWYILADGVTQHRTDGSMIRLVTPLGPGEDEAKGDGRLQDFSRQIAGPLSSFLD
jgi:exosortase D (VPLPA-CTERM-specific)